MTTNLQSIFQNRPEHRKSLPKRQTLSLSVLFLASAISISALVIGILGLGGDGNQIEIEIQSVGISDAGTLSLIGARYSGRTETGGRFDITAEEAIEGVPETGKILLKQPDGFILQKDGSRMNIQAAEAIYDEDSNLLDLEGDVYVTQSRNNLSLRATSLQAALDIGKIVSNQPVELQGPNLVVTGQGLNANETENWIIFTGKSRLKFQPKSNKANP